MAAPDPDASSKLESICENTVVMDAKQKLAVDFVPVLRSGEWSDIGARERMEDTHVCISDLAQKFGCHSPDNCSVSFYGVFDGHGGKDAAHFVRDNLPKIVAEDADFPSELEKVITRSFMAIDSQFAHECTVESSLSSGTTALTAMISGRSLLVANAGDCRAVLSRFGFATEMSKDHRPCCTKERKRVESLGGHIFDGYLNGQLGITRAIGDWHLDGMKETGQPGGPLTSEPELKSIILTNEDEFMIIGSDGIWDVFSNQNAVDFVRRKLQKHNDAETCCRELVEEAKTRGAFDNLTAVLVCFHSNPPISVPIVRPKVRRSISAEGLDSLKRVLESQNN